jgi:hypothetical protein
MENCRAGPWSGKKTAMRRMKRLAYIRPIAIVSSLTRNIYDNSNRANWQHPVINPVNVAELEKTLTDLRTTD